VTAIFLAYSTGTIAHLTMRAWDWRQKPLHILVAFPYLGTWLRRFAEYDAPPLSTMLDSGAFSAWQSGKTIDIDALIETANLGGWDECVALDVIGDSAGSVRNSLYMKSKGVNVIPVFHYGEAWSVLADYCAAFGRVGLSCRFGEPQTKSVAWVEQCFARQWPHLFHSFGWVTEKILARVPFDTADTSSWHTAPEVYGRWQSYGAALRVKSFGTGEHEALETTEVDFFLAMQRRLEEQWADQLHDLRLATLGESLTRRRRLWTSSAGTVPT